MNCVFCNKECYFSYRSLERKLVSSIEWKCDYHESWDILYSLIEEVEYCYIDFISNEYIVRVFIYQNKFFIKHRISKQMIVHGTCDPLTFTPENLSQKLKLYLTFQ